ncbi:MAG: GGDEF domain-containing protein [Cetobacterium sp.]|uniref:GGDEF domain-containing protein n=1 Tax=Cetobacterium sp. TaxID=2071632 RepID=UPI003EE52668
MIKKRYLLFLISILIAFQSMLTLYKKINAPKFPVHIIKLTKKEEFIDFLKPSQKEILENFERLDSKSYNKKYYDIVQNSRCVLKDKHGVQLSSYILEKLVLSDKLSSERLLYVLNRLRLLKIYDFNLIESIEYSLEYIKLAKYLGLNYDVDRGKIGLAVIIAKLDGYNTSNEILLNILNSKNSYKNRNEIEVITFLNLAENNISLGNYTKALDYLDEVTYFLKDNKINNYLDNIEIVVNALYSHIYSILEEKDEAKKYLELAKEAFYRKEEIYFLNEIIYLIYSKEYYNLKFDIENFSVKNLEKLLEKFEYSNGLIFYSSIYELLLEYYIEKYNFEKYDLLKVEYDKKNELLKEFKFEILFLNIAQYIKSGSLTKEYTDLLFKNLRMIIYIIILLIIIILYSRKVSCLNTISNKDFLTGLKNRKAFQKYLDNLNNQKYFMVLFDIDDFKAINDNFGHEVGDEVLKKIGKLLLYKEKNGYFTAFRIGGEEFALLFYKENIDKRTIVQISESVRMDIMNAQWPDSIKVSISGGAGIGDSDAYKKCDNLLYKAKRTGKNKIIYDL